MECGFAATHDTAGTILDQKPDIVVFFCIVENDLMGRELFPDYLLYPVALTIHRLEFYKSLRKGRVKSGFFSEGDLFASNSFK
jgi:hypothetical protein